MRPPLSRTTQAPWAASAPTRQRSREPSARATRAWVPTEASSAMLIRIHTAKDATPSAAWAAPASVIWPAQ
jgi:hypothetical protein